jgi:hypothetical protein
VALGIAYHVWKVEEVVGVLGKVRLFHDELPFRSRRFNRELLFSLTIKLAHFRIDRSIDVTWVLLIQ